MLKIILSHDFKYTAITQIWKLLSNPLILVLIPIFLGKEIQGYWFAFISLAALSVIADMGFTTIILQFSAHEFSNLRFSSKKNLIGNVDKINKISSLFIFSLKWSTLLSVIMLPIIMFLGYLILSKEDSNVNWLLPWIIYVIASFGVFINNVVLSFIEGCDSVGDIQKMKLVISIFNNILLVSGLVFGLDLYALSMSLFISTIIGTTIIIKVYRNLIYQLYFCSSKDKHNWRVEILPLLKKYSISWIAGYFSLAIFTPLAFYYYGSENAGKVGLSIAIWTAVYSISNIWITIIVPKINMYVAKKDYLNLNKIFKKHLIYSVGTYIIGMVVVVLIYFAVLDISPGITDRLLAPLGLLLIAASRFLQIPIVGAAIYMRAHKEEPLMIYSLIAGIYITFTTLIIALFFPFKYYFVGLISSYVWSIPWVYNIFKKYRGINHV